MAKVFIREGRPDHQKFHKTSDCRQLRKAPARGVAHELLELDLNDIKHATPCLTCYPDAPRAKSVHRRCQECNRGKILPCEHNGGVLVYQQLNRPMQPPPYNIAYRATYVWPENARKYMTR